MASLARARSGYFATNFSQILTKKSFNFQKYQRALFHCSLTLNEPEQTIKMPSLSPTMTEGKIVKWLKKEGDTINPGDVLCDIETDKAVVSMETEEEGILAKILVPENSGVIKVGSLIAVMVGEGEDWKNVNISSGAPETASESPASEPKHDKSDVKEIKMSGPPTISVTMPSLSPTMTSGTIVKWLKKEGDTISPGDVLCDIQTDKAVMSMETEEEGILAKIIVPDDTKDVKVGTLIALIVEPGEDWKSVVVSTSVSAVEKGTGSPSQPVTSGSTSSGDREKTYGPAVKALLSSYQLEPGLIKPTGRSNRLLKEDVMKYIEDNKIEKKPPKAVSAPSIKSKTSKPQESPPKPAVTSKPDSTSASCVNPFVDLEISNMRQVIAKKLLKSKLDIPHSYCSVKCDVGKLLEVKNRVQEEGNKVSVNDLITKATACALQIYPKANAYYSNNEIKLSTSVDVSVAVSTKLGLYTPIIKEANVKSIMEISKEIRELAAKAKDGKLKQEEFIGGTFTISNLGMYGITQFKAIINPPQAAILAVGTTIESLSTELKIQKQMIFNLSYDSRILEEHEAAEFLATLKYVIENPKYARVTDQGCIWLQEDLKCG